VASDRGFGDLFGSSVSISGDYAIVGAYNEDHDASGGNGLSNAGSAYIYYRNEGGTDNWGEVTKIVASDRAADDFFGVSVSINGDYAIVGAFWEDQDASGGNTLTNSGSAYILYRNEGGTDNWGEVTKIVASDRAVDDLFGISVSINGAYAIVGAHAEDHDASGGNTLTNSGSAYLFKSSVLGIIESSFGATLTLYPNPTNRNINITFGQQYSNLTVQIRNVIGQQFSSYNFGTTDRVEFEIKGETGLYFIDITTAEGKTAILKVIKN